MAIFPQTKVDGSQIRALEEGFDEGVIENVRRNVSEAGDTQIRDLWLGLTKRYTECDLDLPNPVDSATLIAFKDDNRAASVTFYSYDETLRFNDENIGTGDGTAVNFTIPAKETTGHVVKVNGVTKIIVTHYNISAGSGALGEDRVIFTGGNAPANGNAVTVTFAGRRRYTADLIILTWRTLSTGRKVIHLRAEEAF